MRRLKTFSLYGNDAEIFDFRPGRYHTETAIGHHSEWEKIEKLFSILSEDNRFKIISPCEMLSMIDYPEAGNALHLESAICPVPVKKQGKYNITRWAVTGRDDLGINSACWRVYEALKHNPDTTESEWKELCYLWISDFRTHITERRWEVYCERLKSFEKKLGVHYISRKLFTEIDHQTNLPKGVNLSRYGRYLNILTKHIKICLNCHRGLAIDKLWFRGISDQWLCGTLYHGYYDDIKWGADYYTGHLVMEAPGRAKVTDLNFVEPEVGYDKDNNLLCVRGTIPSPLGDIKKQIEISLSNMKVWIRYEIDWNELPIGALRLGHVTLNPDSFDLTTLFFRISNGGDLPETFDLSGQEVDHSRPVSFLVSAEGGFGMTDGVIEFGDSQKVLRIVCKKKHGINRHDEVLYHLR